MGRMNDDGQGGGYDGQDNQSSSPSNQLTNHNHPTIDIDIDSCSSIQKPSPDFPLNDQPKPDLNAGLNYWNAIAQNDTTNNAVLGGFGQGSLPRVDAMSSRIFILKLKPELSIIKNNYRSINIEDGGNTINEQIKEDHPKTSRRLYRALDVGAGIGRVTSDVLLYLFDRIDLVEPIQGFIETARSNAIKGRWPFKFQTTSSISSSKHNDHQLDSMGRFQKSVRFWNTPIQSFDPYQTIFNPTHYPIQSFDPPPTIIGPQDHWDDKTGYDLIWAQWTLGHLTDEELIEFLKKSKKSLRRSEEEPVGRLRENEEERGEGEKGFKLERKNSKDDGYHHRRHGGLIIIKENIYVDKFDPDGDNFSFDHEDSSITRSHQCFLRIFKQAGLRLISQELQRGFDPDLYKVYFYALQ